MNTGRFVKRLRDELPIWQERGWVTEDNGRAIIEYLEAQQGESRHLPTAIAIFGVLLLGAGVITWFAANWTGIGKLVKLMILLGSLYSTYAIAAFLLRENRYTRTGEAVLLLGIILFGANIMLIAQIYHIDAHFPNGILLWALGGLVTAWLMKSAPAMVATLALGCLWTGSETIGFGRVHWWYLLLWVAILPAVYRWQWRRTFVFALVTLALWSVFTFPAVDADFGTGARLFLMQVYFLAYLAIFIIGLLMDNWSPAERFARAVQGLGIIGTLTCGYALTSPNLQSGSFGYYEAAHRQPADDQWILLNLVATAVAVLLSGWHYLRTRHTETSKWFEYGRLVLAAALVVMIVSLFVDGVHGGPLAIVMNVLFFAGVVWLVYAGMQMGNRLLVNLGFVYFAVTLLTRYFDTFWTLFNRSLFFMVGGLLLIVGGYWLERQRRRITSGIIADRRDAS